MSAETDQAVEFYNQAAHAEASAQWDRAEECYLQSVALCEQAGPACDLQAAKALNRLAELREAFSEHEAALSAAEQAAGLLETPAGDSLSGPEADDLRLQTWELLGNLYRRQARFAEAESALQRALGYALAQFGPDDPRVCEARGRLELLYHSTGESARARGLSACRDVLPAN